ncbi:MAG: N-acetyltransferase [bacterium]|nr:N-acetyltransferase [bacterium]
MRVDDEVIIVPIHRPNEYRTFIDVAFSIHQNHPNYVTPPISEILKLLDKRKNPFWKRAEHQLFLAKRNGQTVGRIAAIHNYAHNEFHRENVGHFGFFEVIADDTVAYKLFQAAEQWLLSRGLECSIGPMNPSTNDECGILINAFDLPPQVMMPWNPPYYPEYIEKCGYRKIKDLYAWCMTNKDQTDRYREGAEKIRKRYQVEIRALQMNKFREEVEIVKHIYNKAWADNWGFFPMSDEEIDYLAESLKPIVDPEICHFAFVNDQPVAFSLAIPNINQAFKKLKRGRLLPLGWLKILWKLKVTGIDELRLLAMGVIPEYRHRGIDVLLYNAVYQSAQKRGYKLGELSWILEDNTRMNQVLANIGAKLYKTYRLYSKQLI